MANNTETDGNAPNWIDDRLAALGAPDDFRPDAAAGRRHLDRRMNRAKTRGGGYLMLAAAAAVTVVALPWPRTLAQELWARFTADRIEVLESDRVDVPESVAATFAMTPQGMDVEHVKDEAEATRITGIVPKLPPRDVAAPIGLAIVRPTELRTEPLDVAAIRRALASAHVDDLTVPDDWQGTTIVAESGYAIVAQYDDMEITQSLPLRMQAPARVQFGRFMELAFRVFGRDATEAKALGEKFQANPALVLHFPERAPVQDVPLRNGDKGIFVGVPDGSDGGICFFWKTDDRIFIVSADKLSLERAVTLADSVK